MRPILTLLFMLCMDLTFSQEFNQEIAQEDGRKFLVGKINFEGLHGTPYSDWYHNGMKTYTVDEALVELIKKDLATFNIKLFLGTWCGDSKRETPRFIKILETAEFPMEQLEIIALDRRKEHYKKSPTGEEVGLHIIKVPTMIFFKDGREVNRIVERPIESLEEDMAHIVLNKPYTPNYAQ